MSHTSTTNQLFTVVVEDIVNQITISPQDPCSNEVILDENNPHTIEVIHFGPQGQSLRVKNESVLFSTGSSTFNFIGSGVNAYLNNGEIIVDIPGGGSGTNPDPGGLPGQIQYNSASAFEGVPVLVYDNVNQLLRATGSFSGSFSGKIEGVLSISGSLVFEPQASPPPNPYGSIYFDGIDFFLGT